MLNSWTRISEIIHNDSIRLYVNIFVNICNIYMHIIEQIIVQCETVWTERVSVHFILPTCRWWKRTQVPQEKDCCQARLPVKASHPPSAFLSHQRMSSPEWDEHVLGTSCPCCCLCVPGGYGAFTYSQCRYKEVVWFGKSIKGVYGFFRKSSCCYWP